MRMDMDMDTDTDRDAKDLDPRTLSRGALVAQLTRIADAQPFFTNWGRTFECTPSALFRPSSVYQCRLALELAIRDGRVLRPVGVGHSPSDVACTRDYMLCMTRMNRVLEVDVNAPHVVAEAGITLTDLHAALAPHGLAMRNLGSISDQTLAGIVTTCTHGSGITFGVLSTHVKALTLLRPDNIVVACSPTENIDLFRATICGLGATGLILTITLELEPAFRLKDEHTMVPFSEVVGNLDTLKMRGEHVRLWWFPAIGRVRVSVANRTTEPARPRTSWLWDSLIGFHFLQVLLLLTRFARASPMPASSSSSSDSSPSDSRPLPAPRATSDSSLTPSTQTSRLRPSFPNLFGQANVLAARLACWLAGPRSVTVDESWKVFNIECRYRQHTTEWALPSERAAACLAALEVWLSAEQTRDGGERPHFPIEIRWSAGDDLWLSPSAGGETCWVGIVQFKPYNLPTRYRALFATFERILAAHGGRPHWAKAHHLDARATRALYPQFGRFLKVVEEVDPTGVFRNEYIERHLMGGAGDGREYKVRQLPPDSMAGIAAKGEAAASKYTQPGKGTERTSSSRQSAASFWTTWGWTWPWRKEVPSNWRSEWRVPPPPRDSRRRSPSKVGSGGDSDSDSDDTLASSVASIVKWARDDNEDTPAPELRARQRTLGRPKLT
ncbi:D-arabinono-1,4-lactone oxidase-domain-containing protein [Mycena maculata]|uniref:D-arabinono-1,4-lactone oxidase n=1 Tax=Mycena maculata TaxID=230809 RepID=A0AAD7NVI2_9AGAR|nr:D-arabinono-1,4-lactone oxidase-domain-containing protein [Mycena maculata]